MTSGASGLFFLYYGLLRHSPHKWLDLVKFVEALLTDKYEVVKIKYSTARVAKNDDDPDMAIKQQQYLEALKSLEKVEVIEGVYKRFRVKLPFAKEPCRSCDKVQYATVVKSEEDVRCQSCQRDDRGCIRGQGRRLCADQR